MAEVTTDEIIYDLGNSLMEATGKEYDPDRESLVDWFPDEKARNDFIQGFGKKYRSAIPDGELKNLGSIDQLASYIQRTQL